MLCEVVESRVHETLVEAVNQAYESEPTNRSEKMAALKVEDAWKYKNFLEVIAELKSKETHHTLNLTK